MIPVDAGFVYPKTGLDADLRMDLTPTYVSTGSYFLDGTGDYIQTNGLTVTTDESDFSFSFWMKVDESKQVSIWRPFGFRNSSTNDRIELWHQSGAFKLLTNNGDGDVLTTAWTVADAVYENVWSHFAFSCDWNGSAMNVTLYINGQSLGAVAMESDVDLSAADTSAIGGGYDGGSAILGNIAHFGVWHAALTQAQVRALMNASTYAEAVTRGGSTPRAYYLLEADVNISAGTGTGRPNGAAQGNAAPYGTSVSLPSGLNLTSSQMNAQVFSGRAIALDGTGDYIKLDGFNFDSTGAWTIESWMKLDTPGAARFWFAIGDANEVTCYYSTGAAGNIGFYPDGAADAYGSALPFCDGSSWHHWCLSVGAGSSATAVLYIDGKQYATSTVTVTDTSSEPKFRFAADANGLSSLDGSITGIKVVVGTAYSAAQALEAYKAPEQPVPSGVTSSHLKCWLGCDYDISGANNLDGLYLQDASGNGNHGLMVNGTAEFAQPTIPQLGLRSSTSRCLFNDSDTVMRLSPSGTDIDCDGAFTYLFWVQTFTTNGDARIIDCISDNGPVVFVDNASGSSVKIRTKVFFGGVAYTWNTAAVALTAGEWAHVGITFGGGTSGEIIYYINGSATQPGGSTSWTDTSPSSRSGTQGADTSVKDIGGASASVVWDGFISEAAIFKDTVLDAAAMTVVFNSGNQGFNLLTDSGDYDVSDSLSGWWKLSNSVSVADLKGSTNGAWNNVPYMSTIPEGATEGLSAMGSLVAKRPAFGTAGPPIRNVNEGQAYSQIQGVDFGTGNLTISTWFRMHRPLAANMSIIGTYDGSAGIDYYATSATSLQGYVEGADDNGVITAISDSDGYADRWYHLVLRREGTSTWSTYLRGLGEAVKASTDLTGKDVGSLSAQTTLVLGSRNNATRYNSGASYAFPRVWIGEAITDAQCNELHEQGARFLRGL